MNQEINNIDLNCDMGEGMEIDEDIMPYISSANIACGYHAGDDDTIARTIESCLRYDVAIGAHPGFADKANFGRKEQWLEEPELYDLVTAQINLVKVVAGRQGRELRHVKPHGALYNMAAVHEGYAHTLVRAVKDVDPALYFFGLSGSAMIGAANAAGLRAANEVFADRTYQDDGTLTPRSHTSALITDEDAMVEQVLQLARQRTVRTLSGKMIPLQADTLCLHGDGIHAVAFAKMIRTRLEQQGILIQKVL